MAAAHRLAWVKTLATYPDAHCDRHSTDPSLSNLRFLHFAMGPFLYRADNTAGLASATFSDTVSRIPDVSRLATLIEPPNNERMR